MGGLDIMEVLKDFERIANERLKCFAQWRRVGSYRAENHDNGRRKDFNNEERYGRSLTEPIVLRFIKPIMT